MKRLEMGEEELIESPTSDRLHSARLSYSDLRASSNGKGTTPEKAKVAAYAEMVERLSVLETGLDLSPYRFLDVKKAKLIHELKTFQNVKGYRWCHQDCASNTLPIEELLRAVPLSKENFEYLKDRSELLRHWIPAYSFIQGREVFVPPLFVRWISSTNGLAAGNTLEEAIIHGFCEVIERWAVMHFIRGYETNVPNVNPNTIEDEEIHSMLAYFESNGVEVTIKDLTGHLPVYAVITTNRNLSPKFVGYNTIKAGCHFDAKEALKRAFTERMQGTSFADERRLGFVNPNETDVMIPLYLKGICMFSLDDFLPGPEVPFREFTYSTTGEAFDQMNTIANTLSSDFIVVNHTHKLLNFPVVRVILPSISDFIGWWEPSRVNVNFLGNISPEEDAYEERLIKFLNTF